MSDQIITREFADGSKVELHYRDDFCWRSVRRNAAGQIDGAGHPAIVEHEKNGRESRSWYLNGQLCRIETLNAQGQLDSKDDQPAVTIIDEDGSVMRLWYKDNLLHREGAPAQLDERADGSSAYCYYDHGKKHRIDGPAEGDRDASGDYYSESWFDHDVAHRVGGPAHIDVSPDSVKKIWCHLGELHCETGPAYSITGSRFREEAYYRHNKLHREDGPATLRQWKGEKPKLEFYRKGVRQGAPAEDKTPPRPPSMAQRRTYLDID